MYRYDYPHPAVTTDIVVFAVRDGAPQVLLIQRRHPPYQDQWALPGGFLDIDEDLEDCARRELAEETGVRAATLEQLRAFGRPGRDPRERVISVAYVTLLDADAVQAQAASDAAAVAWFAYDALPPLAFDHAEIIACAYERVRGRLSEGVLGL